MSCNGTPTLPRAASEGLEKAGLTFGGPQRPLRDEELKDDGGMLLLLCHALESDDGDSALRVSKLSEFYHDKSLAHET